MRNNFFLIMVVCACLASCSSEKDSFVSDQEQKGAFDELKVELAQYSAEYHKENGIMQTRAGFWKRLRGFLFADASGALFGSYFGGGGALFGAIFNSVVAGSVFSAMDNEYVGVQPMPIEPIEPMEPILNPLNDVGTPEDPIEEEYVYIRPYVTVTTDGAGYLHNMIISKIDENYPDVLKNIGSTDLIAGYIADEMESEYGYTISDSTKEMLIQKVDSVNNVDIDWEYDYMVARVNSLLPEYENELAVIEDFVENVEPMGGRVVNVQNYLSGYLQIINNSNLTDEQKQTLRMCIEIAANSAVLWVVE